MVISGNAFASGWSTVQAGTRSADQTATAIARTTSGVDTRTPLEDEMVQLSQSKLAVQSGAKVIAAADETLGTLIDISV
ncbi:MAG: hypothetical protein GAK45_01607 [Pseudomonas citronellolis]|nr:MAG: hypothetical protein GAK45_01607 [Pseudomonas citronellolis]